MIYCTTKQPEDYYVTVDGERFGVWNSYGHDKELFCLMSRILPVFFMYEPGFEGIDPGKVIVEIDDTPLYKKTLDQEIHGVSIRRILHTHNPIEMSDLFLANDVKHLHPSTYPTLPLHSQPYRYVPGSLVAEPPASALEPAPCYDRPNGAHHSGACK